MSSKFLTLLSILFSFIFCADQMAFTKDIYDKKTKLTYYNSPEFQKDVVKYCKFKTPYIAKSKLEVPSEEDGKYIIQRLSDFSTKHQWNKDINPKNSFSLLSSNKKVGSIYHFETITVSAPVFPPTRNVFDYYIEALSDKHIKTCTLYSTLPLEFADFEYKVVSNNGKTYVERTARLVSKLKVPAPIIQKKLEESNKESLNKTVKGILALKK